MRKDTSSLPADEASRRQAGARGIVGYGRTGPHEPFDFNCTFRQHLRGLRGDIDGVIPAREDDDDAAVLRRYLCVHFRTRFLR
jgi:hypothetical protein